MERMDLGGTWWLMEFDPDEGEKVGAFTVDYHPEPRRSFPAKVPGTVHLDLIRNGAIPDPFFGTNELTVQWVEEREWWYRTDFYPPERILARESVDLVFQGLDTIAAIWLNGLKLGETDNMFRTYRIPVKDFLTGGRNVLAVKFAPVTRVADKRMQERGPLWSVFYPSRPYVRKAQYSFGWDWGPRLPTCGIWRPVLLEGYDKGTIRYLFPYLEELPKEGQPAKVRVVATVFATQSFPCQVSFTLEDESGKYQAVLDGDLKPGLQEIVGSLEVSRPSLWFPNGIGRPHLYRLTAQVLIDGSVIDEHEVTTGLRTVELVQEPDEEGKSFVFRINGVPVFCKGANWIPADSFLPRVTEAVYRQSLLLAQDAHMNMLRVWGGGIYEDESFYSQCDQLGIMVWQDFMFACAEYPEDDDFLSEVRAEAEEVVLRLRHHPSIVLWCGNNENDWGFHAGWFGKKERFLGEKIYAAVLPEVCCRLDPTRPYWQSSPFGGTDPNSMSEGDRHSWDVWSGWRSPEGYLTDTGRFVSEFGFQAPPNLPTIESFTLPEDRYPNSRVMEHHNKQGEGTERLYRFVAAYHRVPGTFSEWVRLAQLVQGEALKTGIVHWRRRKFKTAGALFWQLNDCWPVVSWSVVDYFNRPKASYYIIKRAFAPVLVTLFRQGDELSVWLVNDLLRVVSGRLRLSLENLWGEKVQEWERVVAVGSNRSEEIVRWTITAGVDETRHYVLATFTEEGQPEPLASELILLARPKHISFPDNPVEVIRVSVVGSEGEIVLRAAALAKSVILEVLSEPDALWSDNAFDLAAGQEKSVKVTLTRSLSAEELRRRLFIWHLGKRE
ncbi:MAG: glycoside hydrolase family 2 protein [Armatimonadetes bacterium]|nr:glycoside hydrolase family 2 protein [Armatimonadota bacterium]MDW8120708.1 glycoside hydrolase family 2 protein [Armatimonadota bacterium]